MCDLAIEQARRGHAVGVVCDAAGGDRLTEARLAKLAPHLALGLFRTPMSRNLGPSDIWAYWTIRAHATGLRLDVIHGHGAKGGAYSRLVGAALKRAGRPLASCYTPHGGSLHYHPSTLQGRIYMALERRLAGVSDALIFESAYSQSRYADQIGRPACVSEVIPNGLGGDDFATVATASDAADFLFVGELRHLKGVDVLIEALAQVHRIRPVRAVIVGGGPDAQACEQQAARLQLDGVVAFPGPLPARDAFRLGRTLVVPSRAESFPYIVLEAAAAGLPMLATDVGGIPEIVAGTDMALLPPADAAALSTAMLAVLADPDAARIRADRLREAVSRRFTIATMTDAIVGLYGSALAQAR